MKKNNIAKTIVATTISAVGGAIVGLLMAPEKGSSTRKKIAEERDRYFQEMRNNFEILRNDLNKKVGAAKKEIDHFGQDAKNKGKDALNKTQKSASYEERTKDELYDLAKERNIENYSTMNKAELIKALRNH